MDGVCIRLNPGAASAAQLEHEINAVLGMLADPDSEAALAARAANLDPEPLAQARATVRQDGMGYADVPIDVWIQGSIAIHIANTLWDQVILPRIKARLGHDAAGQRRDEPAEDTAADSD